MLPHQLHWWMTAKSCGTATSGFARPLRSGAVALSPIQRHRSDSIYCSNAARMATSAQDGTQGPLASQFPGNLKHLSSEERQEYNSRWNTIWDAGLQPGQVIVWAQQAYRPAAACSLIWKGASSAVPVSPACTYDATYTLQPPPPSLPTYLTAVTAAV